MAQRIRMVNKESGQVKYMPEATSKLATILSRWRVEDAEVQTHTQFAQEFIDDVEKGGILSLSEADSKEALPTETATEATAETTETAAEKPAPKPTAKRKSKAKAKK